MSWQVLSFTCLGLGLGDTIPEDFGVLELCRKVIGSCSLCERSWLRSGIRLESGGYVVGEVDDVAALSLEPVVRSPRFYAQFVELVNAIKTRFLFTPICPLIVSPKSHHHHRRSGRYLDVSGCISAPFRSTLKSFVKLLTRPFDLVSIIESIRLFVPKIFVFSFNLTPSTTFGLSLHLWPFRFGSLGLPPTPGEAPPPYWAGISLPQSFLW